MKEKLTCIALCMLMAISLTACTSAKDLPTDVSQLESESEPDMMEHLILKY